MDILRPQLLQTCQGVRLQSPFLQALKAAAEHDQAYLLVFKSVVKGEKNVDSNYGIEKRKREERERKLNRGENREIWPSFLAFWLGHVM